MTGTKHFLLGLFFLAAFGVLAVYSLFLYDNDWFGKRTPLRVEFPAANGLRVGDSVRAFGMNVGRVTQMSFDATAEPDRRIAVTLSLETPLVLREGYEILIEETTLLGGRNVNIDMGPPDAPVLTVTEDTVLAGTMETSAFAALEEVGALVSDNSEYVQNILSNIDAIVAGARAGEGTVGRLLVDEELSTRVGDAVDGFATTMEDASAITSDIRAGKGTFGRLFVEEDLYVAADEFMQDLRSGMADLEIIIADLEEGRGTMGALFRDEELADTVRGAVDDIGRIVERAEAGEGTLGRLLTDDAIADEIETVLQSLNSTDGVLGGLINDDQMGEDLRVALADIADIVATVKAGEGTIGALLMDDEVYQEVLTAVQLLTRSLEDYREAAPVSTFTTVLFGAF